MHFDILRSEVLSYLFVDVVAVSTYTWIAKPQESVSCKDSCIESDLLTFVYNFHKEVDSWLPGV